jgi:hypothetical protein
VLNVDAALPYAHNTPRRLVAEAFKIYFAIFWRLH